MISLPLIPLCNLKKITLFVYLLLGLHGLAWSQSLPDELSVLDKKNISRSVIDFVNLSSAPGLSGAAFRVENDNREIDLSRSNLGFLAEFSLKNYIFNGFWGATFVQGSLKDKLLFNDESLGVIDIRVDRKIRTLQGLGGLSFPINKNLRFRPYFSLSTSRIDTEASATIFNSTTPTSLKSETESLTSSMTSELLYDRWFNSVRLELSGQYALAYTDTYDASNTALDTFGWSNTFVARARLSAPTAMQTQGRVWWWNTYFNHVNFIGQEKISLGFNHYSEIGVGLDYEMNIRPLDWFGLRYVGLKVGAIFGKDVEGASIGLTFR